MQSDVPGELSGAPAKFRAVVMDWRPASRSSLLSRAGFRGKFWATFEADHGVAAGSAADLGGDG
jgi:hypothetical protein